MTGVKARKWLQRVRVVRERRNRERGEKGGRERRGGRGEELSFWTRSAGGEEERTSREQEGEVNHRDPQSFLFFALTRKKKKVKTQRKKKL